MATKALCNEGGVTIVSELEGDSATQDVDAEHTAVFSDPLFRKKKKKGKYSLVYPPDPPLEATVADTHAHVHLLWDPAGALACAATFGVDFIMDIVDSVEDGFHAFEAMPEWCHEAQLRLDGYRTFAEETYGAALLSSVCTPHVPHIRYALGCHPHNAKDFDSAAEQELIKHLAHPAVAAIGEIGLDYHYDFSPRKDQRACFRRQLQLAHECGLPVALHLREAHEEAYQILCEEGFPEAGTLLHCFNLDKDTLAPFVEAGCYIAFGGPITFKAADEVREAACCVPLDRLLTETDSPYMTPEPMRGMICGPAHTIFTAQRLAEVCGRVPGEDRKAFLEALGDNARRLLDRPPTAWQSLHSEAASC